MLKKHKALYAVLGIVGALVVLLGSVGVAHAQGPQPPVGSCLFYSGGTCGCAGGMVGGSSWGMGGFSLVDATAEATGLTVDQVIAALQEGKTFAQIAQEAGVAQQAIVDAFLADREAALVQAVADGRLTQEQADQMLAEMAEHVSERLNQTWTPRSFGGRLEWGASGPGFAPRGGRQVSGNTYRRASAYTPRFSSRW